MTALIEKPLVELAVGSGVLAALSIHLIWIMRAARMSRARRSTPSSDTLEPGARQVSRSAPRTARQPLPPLASLLRPLGALRDHDPH